MSTSRTLVRASLVIGAIAVCAALWVRGGAEDEEPAEELGSSAETPPEPPEPFDEPEPAPRPIAKAPAQPVRPTPPPEAPVKPMGPEPFEPQIREHAILMMSGLAKEAMESGQLEQLKIIQQQLRERPTEGLMPPNDAEAVNIAIGCLENGPDAREDATDFIEYGTPHAFGDSLKKACFGDDNAAK